MVDMNGQNGGPPKGHRVSQFVEDPVVKLTSRIGIFVVAGISLWIASKVNELDKSMAIIARSVELHDKAIEKIGLDLRSVERRQDMTR